MAYENLLNEKIRKIQLAIEKEFPDTPIMLEMAYDPMEAMSRIRFKIALADLYLLELSAVIDPLV